MNLNYTAEEESFRAEVRAFFEAELPADIRSKVRFGALGVVDELNVSHYFKRLTMIDMTFGDADHHLARFSDALGVEAVGAAS